MAEGTVVYDANGRAVGTVGVADAAGSFIMGPPPESAAAQGNPAVTPEVEDTNQHRVTTQQVQAAGEYADGGEVQGGDTYIPFGPVINLPEDGSEPPYAWMHTNIGPRRTFRIARSIGLMPLLRFAHAAKQGMDTEDLEGMAALYDMISDTVDPGDWGAFQQYAVETKAEDEELMEFVSAAMEVITARPRKPRGSSSATSRSTPQRSRGSSSGQGSVIPPGAIQPPEVDGLMPVSDLVK